MTRHAPAFRDDCMSVAGHRVRRADPGSAVEQVRALVRMCNDASASTVTLPMIVAMSHRLLPFIATSESAMESIAEAMERAQPRAAAADAEQPGDFAAEDVDTHGKAA